MVGGSTELRSGGTEVRPGMCMYGCLPVHLMHPRDGLPNIRGGGMGRIATLPTPNIILEFCDKGAGAAVQLPLFLTEIQISGWYVHRELVGHGSVC